MNYQTLMKRRPFLALWSCFLCALETPAIANMLKTEGPPERTISAVGITVPVHAKATLKLPEGHFAKLHLTGAGIYRKPIGLITLPVYAAVHYTDLPEGLDPSQPMSSIKKAQFKAIQLIALYELSASDIRTAFEEALDINGVDLSEAGIHEALKKAVFNAKPGDVATLIGYNADSVNQGYRLEFKKDTVATFSPSIADTFWRVWFDVPVDTGIAQLKKQLMLGH